MSKEIEEIRFILNKITYPTENELKDILMYVNNTQSKLSELEQEVDRLQENEVILANEVIRLERENKQLHEDKKFYSEQWEKVSKENENIIEDIEYIIEHCANGTEYVYDELNKILTNNTNK